jgi:hypothetical protein
LFAAASESIVDTSHIYYSILPLLAALIPLLTGIAIYFLKDSWEVFRKAVALAAALFSFLAVIGLFPLVMSGKVYFDLIDFMQMGLFLKLIWLPGYLLF